MHEKSRDTRIIVVIPAHNEEDTIERVVHDVREVIPHVVVVDDGSMDATAARARRAGAVVVLHAVNRGQGAALETGHAYARRARADVVVHFDADGQFDVRDLVPALDHLFTSGADVLFGSRFLDHRTRMPWTKRLLVVPVARLIDRIAGGLPLSDAHNGFRMLTKRALRVVRVTQDHMAHATEIPALVREHGLTYIEHPVHVRYHAYGQRPLAGLRIVYDLLVKRFVA
jgi:polyprenyl-phospho-N-acetylgalactosaminyl synthase